MLLILGLNELNNMLAEKFDLKKRKFKLWFSRDDDDGISIQRKLSFAIRISFAQSLNSCS